MCIPLAFDLWWAPITLTFLLVDYVKPFQMLFINSTLLLTHAQKVSSMRRRTLSLLAATSWMLLIIISLTNEEKGEDTLSLMLCMVAEGLEKIVI